MKNKIIVLIGAPASGKTVLAHKMHEEDPSKVIVSRDALREARGTYRINSQEDYISDCEEFQVRAAIKRGLTPIIDSTNLNPNTMNKWKKLAEELQCELEEIKMPYIPFEEALRRDKERGKAGGHMVGFRGLSIFYRLYYKEQFIAEVGTLKCPSTAPDTTKIPAVIFDLDRTILYRNGRDIYDFEAAGNDVVDPRALQLIKQLIAGGVEIIISTGRTLTDKSIEAIDQALQLKPDIPNPYWLFGKAPNENHLRSVVVKEENLNKINELGLEVLAAFDDDEECVEMYRSHGIFACKIN